jgi:hypothetical protein
MAASLTAGTWRVSCNMFRSCRVRGEIPTHYTLVERYPRRSTATPAIFFEVAKKICRADEKISRESARLRRLRGPSLQQAEKLVRIDRPGEHRAHAGFFDIGARETIG